jgi:hypothetical protein
MAIHLKICRGSKIRSKWKTVTEFNFNSMKSLVDLWDKVMTAEEEWNKILAMKKKKISPLHQSQN